MPETKDLIEAYLHAQPLGEAARDLGFARGLQGVGITETIEDLGAFFSAAGGTLDITIQQRLTEGWAVAAEATDPVSCADPLTGLPTVEHFNRVLQDLFNSTGFNPDDYVIGRIALPPFPGGPTRRWAVLAELGLCCQKAFAGSGASIAFLDNTINVLMVASNENYARMISCHTALMNVTYFPWNPEEITYDSLSRLAAKLPSGI
ncbi:hypothetical protein AB4Y88_00035 [Paenarthrobacter sp. RAF9]